MSKYIIFGASGFIGQHFIEQLVKDNQEIVGFDLIKKENIHYVDVRNKIEVSINCNPDDIIINLAAVHKTPGYPDKEYFETNILGAKNICDFASKNNVKTIIFTSSISVYGMSEVAKSENSLPMPNTPYGISKLTAEYIHKNWQKENSERKLLILRPGVVFGKNEGGNFTRLYKTLKKKRFFYPGRKDTIKACIYVKHLIKTSLRLIEKKDSGVETYNFTYHPAPSIEQIVSEVSKVSNLSYKPILVNGRLLMAVASIAKKMGFSRMGIHPERVKKLMISNHIIGDKLNPHLSSQNFDFKAGLKDWYKDCGGELS